MGKRIIRYLKGTAALGIVYRAGPKRERLEDADKLPTKLVAWGDSDFAGREFDSLSTNGKILTFNDVPFDFSTAVEKSGVATSTCQAETSSAKHACHAIEWASDLLTELGVRGTGPVTLWQDNKSTIQLSSNPVMHKRSKHFRINTHYIQQLVKTEAIAPSYVSTDEMLADLMNKAHHEKRFLHLREMARMETQVVSRPTHAFAGVRVGEASHPGPVSSSTDRTKLRRSTRIPHAPGASAHHASTQTDSTDAAWAQLLQPARRPLATRTTLSRDRILTERQLQQRQAADEEAERILNLHNEEENDDNEGDINEGDVDEGDLEFICLLCNNEGMEFTNSEYCTCSYGRELQGESSVESD